VEEMDIENSIVITEKTLLSEYLFSKQMATSALAAC
jgi:hypothetical protein